MLKQRLAPDRMLTAMLLLDDAERELRRFRGPVLDVEDFADRESALAKFAEADKVLATYPVRLAGGAR
ncbi:hypothetical protein [Streptomyces flavidovirens]|uniref:hypothetical protein n=1 Tax=Streptomyces flavidovirens TaxID=67298 RepID=UPI0036CB6335